MKLAALALGWLVVAAGCSRTPPPATVAPLAAPLQGLAQDERIAFLLASKRHTEVFQDDTSQLVPALVSKLASGQSDPLAQAKMDLAAAGERALPDLKRFFDACYADEALAARLINALDCVALMEPSLGRPILLRGLDHPVASVRLAALRGMGKQALPEDFERLKLLAGITGSEGHEQLAMALWHADSARLVRELPEWIDGGRMPGQVILALGPLLSRFEDKPALLPLKPLAPRLAVEFQCRVLAALARAGDEDSLKELRAWLHDPVMPRREFAARCLTDAGLARELLPSLREEGYLPARLLAAQGLRTLPMDDELRGAFATALGDPSEEVRAVALAALVDARDASGENEALELLKGERPDLERGLRALRDAMAQRPELCERVLGVLDGLRSGSLQPLRVELSSIWRAMAQVPSEHAARILYDELQHQPSPDKHFSASRWFTTQIGNTGPAGWRFVRACWATENDPQRRLDLMNASCYDRGEDGRAFLESALASGRMTPLELRYAANQLVHMGPAERVAPLLKRVALGVDDKTVRPALNSLLWTWYGLES